MNLHRQWPVSSSLQTSAQKSPSQEGAKQIGVYKGLTGPRPRQGQLWGRTQTRVALRVAAKESSFLKDVELGLKPVSD